MRPQIFVALFILLPSLAASLRAESSAREISIVSSLGDPSKTAPLKARGATANRLVKICFHLHDAKSKGISPEGIVSSAIESWGWGKTLKGDLTAKAILHAFTTLEAFGCFEEAEDRELMRRGGRPTIRRGRFSGEPVEMDHIVPVSAAPEWTQTIANLEPLPESENRAKGDSIDAKVSRHREMLLKAGF